ncbi:bifunctional riboflavin kinase/FAD synthetase [Actinomyces vulturis]|uniref:bifunctional riboflavin kinase/FAD synthetase n=1 Tax=Actinomyces vulturis TaxID=1857645 RepID=UPI00083174C2|nr:bifunctional riboflavin kinase/FAD synthetase [Actinomyces vulturis]
MQVWYSLEDFPAELADRGTVVCLGIFDGVHRGHQAVFERAQALAQELDVPCLALTFDPHPVQVHRPEQCLELITSLADRLEYLEQTGLDGVMVINYSLEFADQSPREFVENYLHHGMGARGIVVGADVRFGRANTGDRHALEELGKELGIAIAIVDDVLDSHGKRFSSTRVREALARGDVRAAAQVLGRSHRLRGPVIRGLQRGRQLGYPTANLAAAGSGVVPPDGVYAGWLVRSSDDGSTYRLPAAISVGTNPTFDDVPERTVEAHVLGRADLNLYGENVGVEFVEFLRPMLAFDGIEPLLVEMRRDCVRAASILGVPEPDPIDPNSVTAM